MAENENRDERYHGDAGSFPDGIGDANRNGLHRSCQEDVGERDRGIHDHMPPIGAGAGCRLHHSQADDLGRDREDQEKPCKTHEETYEKSARQNEKSHSGFAANGSFETGSPGRIRTGDLRLTVECSTAELPGIICAAEVRLLIQMLFRFAKRFFKKNDGRRCRPVEKAPTVGSLVRKKSDGDRRQEEAFWHRSQDA